MNIQQIDITKITPYDKNPRVNADAVQYVKRSIEEFGFRQPIVVDEDMIIIIGHTRLLAAKELGLTEAPVHIAKDLTLDKVKALRLVDNKVSEKAYWDNALLQEEMADLAIFDLNMSEFGFDDFETKGAFGADDDDVSDTLFDDEEQDVNMFSSKIQIVFECPRDLSEAQKIFELSAKEKKIKWKQVSDLLK